MDRNCFHVGVFGSPAMTSTISGMIKGGTTHASTGESGDDGWRPAREGPAIGVPAELIVYCQAQRASIHDLGLAPATKELASSATVTRWHRRRMTSWAAPS